MVINDPSKNTKMSKFFITNLKNFWTHFSTFRAKKIAIKNRPCQKTIFFDTKIFKNEPSNPPKWANVWPITVFFGVIYQPLELKVQSKVGLLRQKIVTQHIQNNFEKVQKTTFLNPKMVKNDPSNPSKWAYFWPKISIFGVIFQPLEL